MPPWKDLREWVKQERARGLIIIKKKFSSGFVFGGWIRTLYRKIRLILYEQNNSIFMLLLLCYMGFFSRVRGGGIPHRKYLAYKGVHRNCSPNSRVFSKGYQRYLTLCLTSSVSQCVSVFKTHIRVLLDHVGSGNFAWKYKLAYIQPPEKLGWASSATLKICISGEDRTRPELTQP